VSSSAGTRVRGERFLSGRDARRDRRETVHCASAARRGWRPAPAPRRLPDRGDRIGGEGEAAAAVLKNSGAEAAHEHLAQLSTVRDHRHASSFESAQAV